jgi:N-acetylglucosaminyldiphosphoundecaprenol N-acetyl-beta-D-mannosaminyltransferase
MLMVRMGMPRQERLDTIDQIQCHVLLPAGACFDYVAGVVLTASTSVKRQSAPFLASHGSA